MNKELKQLLVACKVTLAVLWPASAWAASIAFGDDLAKIPMLSVLATVILSTVLGATALLHWMIEQYEVSDKIPRLGLQVASRMLSSNAAGLVAFAVLESWDIPTGYKAGAIMLAAFGGTWSIQRALQFAANKYVPQPQKEPQP
jgi:hypothetical protein